MDAMQPHRGAVFAKGLATAAGWHLVLVAVAVLWWFSLSDVSSSEECPSFGCRWTERDIAVLAALFVGIPALGASALVSAAVVGGLAAARVRSGVLAGTAGAIVGWLAAAATALAYLAPSVPG